jgi:S1-C subfamily serine protease
MGWNKKQFSRKLSETIKSLDKNLVEKLIDKLILHIRSSEKPYPEKDAVVVLGKLREQRYFKLMEMLCDAFIQSGQQSAHIRRQYAQALLEDHNLTAAIYVLNDIIRDARKVAPEEVIEAQGLLGRAYKQLYVNAVGARSPWILSALKKSLKHYHKVYQSDPKQCLWHGINAVALLIRARQDGVRLRGYPVPEELATSILQIINKKHKRKKVQGWDFAIAAEACLGMNNSDDALKWIHGYVKNTSVDAFQLASFERQLIEVWKLDPISSPGSLILPLVRQALLQREGGVVRIKAKAFHSSGQQKKADTQQLQRILGRDGVQSYQWMQMALDRARCVARIGLSTDIGEGTGFLVKGSDLFSAWGEEMVLLTNAHVINSSFSSAIHPDDAVITFEALNGANEKVEYAVDSVLWSSPPDQLDTSIIKLNKPVECATYYPVHPRLPAAQGDSRVYIIGHPRGGSLAFSIQDNKLLDHEAPLIHYHAPTEPGSSGSPVFNSQWKLIAIHHAGGSKMQKLNGQKGSYPANEGIWIESIRKRLKSELG